MTGTKKDITERKDIIELIDRFYDKVKIDELLGPVFAHLDWPKHMPTMYNFWSSMILGDMTYQGNPLQKHLHLAIDSKHFARWLGLFCKTVDDLYEGPGATEIKDRARSIAGVFQHKLGLID
jgi:hemoglobin